MAAQKKKTGKKAAPPPQKQACPVRREVGGFVCLLLALCVLVSYFGVQAFFLTLLEKLLKGLTGYGYWLWAAALAVVGVVLVGHGGRPVCLRVTGTLAIPVLSGSLLHLLLCRVAYAPGAIGLPSLRDLWVDGLSLRGGGALSGGLAALLKAGFSSVVAGVLLALLLAGAVLLMLHKTPQEVAQRARERRESARLARAEDEAARLLEEEESPAALPAAKRARGRSAIDIPIDEPPAAQPVKAETLPEEQTESGLFQLAPKRKLFSRRGEDVRTPDEVLRPQAEPAPAPEPAPTAQETAESPAVRPAAKRQDASADVQSAAEEVGRAIEDELAEPEDEYRYPPITLLDENHTENYAEVGAELRGNSRRLAQTLQSFGVDAQAGEVVHGPSVTRYEFTLDQGVKLSKITNLSDDIALALGASGVRIAPIPNKISVVGIEVPNRTVTTVRIRDVIESRTFTEHRSRVAFAVGKDIGGKAIVGDISKLPHVLIAGTTGSGKSVCTNSLIISMLYKSTPEEVRFIMVDPKMVELAPYNGIPHLLIPVVTDPKKAAGALQWAVYEMMKRYKLFSENGVKDLAGFNALAEHSEELKKMPTMVVVIDELADLMLVAAKEVEESICRVAQMGRAAGMHLVIATQRPSSDVITGLMKANIPSRIAFAVASSLESRIILDTTGAEKLVGKGDMLYFPLGSGKPQRVQGCFISPEEIERVVAFVKETGEADYSSEVMEKIEEAARRDEKGGGKQAASDDSTSDCDELFNDAVEVVLETGQASVSMLQRRLKLGYSRAARLVDQMEEHGIVGPFEGSKPRQLLIDRAKWQERQMGRQAAESAPKPDRFGSIQDVFESHDALE